MGFYLLKLLILLPLMAGLIYGCLWLYRKYLPQMQHAAEGAIVVKEVRAINGFFRLMVVEFDGQRLLLSVSRNGVEKIADGLMVDG
jgi:flagellar protein FliO/FliZ